MSHCTSCYGSVCKGCTYVCDCSAQAKHDAARERAKKVALTDAAPDLLEACKRLLSWLPPEGAVSHDSELLEENRADREFANDVIRRVRGGV